MKFGYFYLYIIITINKFLSALNVRTDLSLASKSLHVTCYIGPIYIELWNYAVLSSESQNYTK